MVQVEEHKESSRMVTFMSSSWKYILEQIVLKGPFLPKMVIMTKYSCYSDNLIIFQSKAEFFILIKSGVLELCLQIIYKFGINYHLHLNGLVNMFNLLSLWVNMIRLTKSQKYLIYMTQFYICFQLCRCSLFFLKKKNKIIIGKHFRKMCDRMNWTKQFFRGNLIFMTFLISHHPPFHQFIYSVHFFTLNIFGHYIPYFEIEQKKKCFEYLKKSIFCYFLGLFDRSVEFSTVQKVRKFEKIGLK